MMNSEHKKALLLIKAIIFYYHKLNQEEINMLEETAAELERRFLNAIRTAEPAKFKRGIKKIQESKNDIK